MDPGRPGYIISILDHQSILVPHFFSVLSYLPWCCILYTWIVCGTIIKWNFTSKFPISILFFVWSSNTSVHKSYMWWGIILHPFSNYIVWMIGSQLYICCMWVHLIFLPIQVIFRTIWHQLLQVCLTPLCVTYVILILLSYFICLLILILHMLLHTHACTRHLSLKILS